MSFVLYELPVIVVMKRVPNQLNYSFDFRCYLTVGLPIFSIYELMRCYRNHFSTNQKLAWEKAEHRFFTIIKNYVNVTCYCLHL